MSFHIKINVKVIGALHYLCVTEMYIFDAISWLRFVCFHWISWLVFLFGLNEFHGWCPLKSVSLLSHVEVYQVVHTTSTFSRLNQPSLRPSLLLITHTSKSALDNSQSHCVYRSCMFPSIWIVLSLEYSIGIAYWLIFGLS